MGAGKPRAARLNLRPQLPWPLSLSRPPTLPPQPHTHSLLPPHLLLRPQLLGLLVLQVTQRPGQVQAAVHAPVRHKAARLQQANKDVCHQFACCSSCGGGLGCQPSARLRASQPLHVQVRNSGETVRKRAWEASQKQRRLTHLHDACIFVRVHGLVVLSHGHRPAPKPSTGCTVRGRQSQPLDCAAPHRGHTALVRRGAETLAGRSGTPQSLSNNQCACGVGPSPHPTPPRPYLPPRDSTQRESPAFATYSSPLRTWQAERGKCRQGSGRLGGSATQEQVGGHAGRAPMQARHRQCDAAQRSSGSPERRPQCSQQRGPCSHHRPAWQ